MCYLRIFFYSKISCRGRPSFLSRIPHILSIYMDRRKPNCRGDFCVISGVRDIARATHGVPLPPRHFLGLPPPRKKSSQNLHTSTQGNETRRISRNGRPSLPKRGGGFDIGSSFLPPPVPSIERESEQVTTPTSSPPPPPPPPLPRPPSSRPSSSPSCVYRRACSSHPYRGRWRVGGP